LKAEEAARLEEDDGTPDVVYDENKVLPDDDGIN
jgi:hypothetical protein